MEPCFTVQTSVADATKSCCKSLSASQGILAACLLRNLMTEVDNLLSLPHPGIVATIPLTLNVKTFSSCISWNSLEYCFSVFLSSFVQDNNLSTLWTSVLT